MSTPAPARFTGLASLSKDKWADVKKVDYAVKPFGPHDVDIKVECCGICSSDIHTLKAEWGRDNYYPLVVGHEIIGEVVATGDEVTTLKVGDRVGVGAQSLACLECEDCKNDNEQYCAKLRVGTYNTEYPDGSISKGGYANYSRVHEHFAFKIPDGLPSDIAAPMLCAGITVYSPLKRYFKKGMNVGVIGLGGLGSHAVIFAKHIFGAEVYLFSRTDSKKEDALKMGVDNYIATSDPKNFDKYFRSIDLIIGTANSSKGFDLGSYLSTLKVNGKYVTVGLPADGSFEVSARTFIRNGAFMSASSLGSRKEIIEMLDAAAKANIKTWIEKIPINEKNAKDALVRMEKNDVKYRFVFTDYDKEFA